MSGILLFILLFYYFTTGPYLDLSDPCFRFLHIILLLQFDPSKLKPGLKYVVMIKSQLFIIAEPMLALGSTFGKCLHQISHLCIIFNCLGWLIWRLHYRYQEFFFVLFFSPLIPFADK